MKLLLFLILAVLCWPLAAIYAFVWVCLLPFKAGRAAANGVAKSISNILSIPGRALKK